MLCPVWSADYRSCDICRADSLKNDCTNAQRHTASRPMAGLPEKVRFRPDHPGDDCVGLW